MPSTRACFGVAAALFVASPALADPTDARPTVVYRTPFGIDADAAWEDAAASLADLVERADRVLVGEILTTRELLGARGRSTSVSVVVDETLRGPDAVGGVLDIEVPLDGALSGEAPRRAPPVRGDVVILFLGEDGRLIDEDAVFVIEGGFAWRPRRRGVMSSPSRQRDWGALADPIGEYDVLAMSAIREALLEAPTPQARRRRRR